MTLLEAQLHWNLEVQYVFGEILSAPASEGTPKVVRVALAESHLNSATPQVELLVNVHLIPCQCSGVAYFAKISLYFSFRWILTFK